MAARRPMIASAQCVVRERLRGLSRDQPHDLAGDVLAALDRGLGELGEILRSDGDVIGGEHSVRSLHLQVRAHPDAVALVERQAPVAHLLVGRDAGRPDGEIGGQHGAVREHDGIRSHLFDARAEAPPRRGAWRAAA